LNVRMATEVMNLQLHKYWASLSPLLPSLIKSLEVPESPQTRISRKYGPKSVRSRFAVQWGKGGNSKCCFAMSGKHNLVLGPVWLGMSEIVFGKRAVGTLRCLERLASYRELQLREASRNKRHTHTQYARLRAPTTLDTRPVSQFRACTASTMKNAGGSALYINKTVYYNMKVGHSWLSLECDCVEHTDSVTAHTAAIPPSLAAHAT
jgi:hypothetical protein